MAENVAKVKEESPVPEDGDLKTKENEPSPDDRGKDTKDEDSREWKRSGTFLRFLISAYPKRTSRGPLG
jgi:hypothetical protein